MDLRVTIAAAAFLSLALVSPRAQPADPSAAPGAGNPPHREAPAEMLKKREDCRQQGASQGLKGPDLTDHVQVCVEEARLACLKQAVAQKVRGHDRGPFIRKCLGS